MLPVSDVPVLVVAVPAVLVGAAMSPAPHAARSNVRITMEAPGALLTDSFFAHAALDEQLSELVPGREPNLSASSIS